MLRGLAKILSRGARFVLRLAVGMGGERFLLATGSAFVIGSLTFLLEGPLLFRITLFIGVFILAFVAAGRLFRRLSK